MRRSLPIAAILSAILHASALAQGLATVSGIVVDYSNSTPLPGVYVRLFAWGLPQTTAYGAVSGPDGRFFISHVPPGEYRAIPEEPAGYFFVPLVSHDKRDSDLTLNAGDRRENLLLHLARTGVITGRVIGDDGEPIEGSQVYPNPAEEPRLPNLTHCRGGVTDDRGEYRVLCSPGKFLVQIVPFGLGAQNSDDIRADGKNFDYDRTGVKPPVDVQPDSQTRLIDINLSHRTVRTSGLDPEDDAGVEGKVIDSANGNPLSHARVTLRPGLTEGDRGLVMRTHIYYGETKTDGSFTMEGLAPGWYMASVARSGFVSSPIFSKRYTLKRGEKTKITFGLSPAAVINGRVLDENGNPLGGVNVSAIRDPENDPRNGLFNEGYRSGSLTNERGEYKIRGLKGGRFRVRADIDYRDQRGIPPETPDVKSDVIYGPTFYPSTPNEASSSWIEVRAGGEKTGVEITLLRAPILSVSGHVKGIPGSDYTKVEIAPLDNGFTSELQAGPDGGFTFWRLPPGHYQFTASGYGSTGRVGDSEAVKVEIVDRSIAGVELVVRPIAAGASH